jgi:hypothetical protein
MSNDQAPVGYEFTEDGRLVPTPPRDTAECVFVGRAIDQIAKARNVSIEDARGLAVEAIDTKQLKLRARLMQEPSAPRTPENIFAVVSPTSFMPERWAEILVTGHIEARDKRYWVPIAQRRRIPVAHWLFFTRRSLDTFLSPQAANVETEPSLQLTRASQSMIRKTIRSVYGTREKAPNIVELPKVVQPILKADGYSASQRCIQEIGREPEFVKLRGQPGKRLTVSSS